ncbi:MAG TPA: hypothetical protein VLG37_00025, partial [Candidatus Saccharimonadales bacterium]|nr:hypothetical protein [Candidatus Saccharimonadales bacterium]
MKQHTKQPAPEAESDLKAAEAADNPTIKQSRWNWRKWADFKNYSRKQQAIAAAILLLVLALAVPLTRYPILGLAIKKDASIKLLDAKSHTPLSEALVSINGHTQKTDSKGMATIHGVKVGPAKATVTKKYYQTASLDVFVGLASSKQVEAKVTPLGRPVKVKITDRISGKPVAKAAVIFGKEKFLTGESGVAVVILPSSTSE